MASQPDLFGYYKPPTGITIAFVLDDPGGTAAGTLTVTVHHQRPTPPTTMSEHLDQYEAHDLPSIVARCWRPWEHQEDQHLRYCFQVACAEVKREYVH